MLLNSEQGSTSDDDDGSLYEEEEFGDMFLRVAREAAELVRQEPVLIGESAYLLRRDAGLVNRLTVGLSLTTIFQPIVKIFIHTSCLFFNRSNWAAFLKIDTSTMFLNKAIPFGRGYTITKQHGVNAIVYTFSYLNYQTKISQTTLESIYNLAEIIDKKLKLLQLQDFATHYKQVMNECLRLDIEKIGDDGDELNFYKNLNKLLLRHENVDKTDLEDSLYVRESLHYFSKELYEYYKTVKPLGYKLN